MREVTGAAGEDLRRQAVRQWKSGASRRSSGKDEAARIVLGECYNRVRGTLRKSQESAWRMSQNIKEIVLESVWRVLGQWHTDARRMGTWIQAGGHYDRQAEDGVGPRKAGRHWYAIPSVHVHRLRLCILQRHARR